MPFPPPFTTHVKACITSSLTSHRVQSDRSPSLISPTSLSPSCSCWSLEVLLMKPTFYHFPPQETSPPTSHVILLGA